MDSMGLDPTLPLDFDGSTNMHDLPEVTLGGEPSDHHLTAHSPSGSSHSSSSHALLLPNVAKCSSGRMSPVKGRTMKEYDQQITDLKKENFSLKLRIYFLEERMQQKFGDGEDVFKTNIELKVSVQSLKKELEDKHELLRKASLAMETLTFSQQSDIDALKKKLEEQHHRYTQELRADLQKALQDAESATEEVERTRERTNQLELRLRQMELEQQQFSINTQKLKDTIEVKERDVAALQLESDSYQRSLEETQGLLQEAQVQHQEAQHKVEQMEKDLKRRGRDVERLSMMLRDTSMIDSHSLLAPDHMQDVLDDQQDHLQRLRDKVGTLEGQLRDREATIGRLEEGLKEKERAWTDASNELQQFITELEHEKQLRTRCDKTIQGLITSLHNKEKEVAGVKSRLTKSESALKTLKAELHEAEMANHQERLKEQLADSESSRQRLQTQLDEANTEVENMIRSLGKTEGELAGFKEQLQQATQALQRSEEALESLQVQLEKERAQSHSRVDKQGQEYQHTLGDLMQQLEGKDGLLAHMTAQLRAKDKQLTSLMDLLTDDTNKSQKALLQRLEDDLNKSASTTQSTLEGMQSELERKGKELREARQTLQDKSQQLEDLQRQLLDTQQQLEKADLSKRQQAESSAQLASALSKAQNSLEEALDRHSQILQEKDAIVLQLQKALQEKEAIVEELNNNNKAPDLDKQQQKLRAQLRDNELLIQELQTQCIEAACQKEQAAGQYQARLQEKEEELQALVCRLRKELGGREEELGQAGARLAQRELQLQSLQDRLALGEEQQRDTLQSLRRVLADNDKTIQALVESMEEKERLLRRSQQNLTEDAKTQLAELDTLLADNARLKRLLREKEEILSVAGQQAGSEGERETRHSTSTETIVHTTSIDNSEVCRLLQEQLRQTEALSELLRQGRNEMTINLSTDQRPLPSEPCSREGSGKVSDASLQAELSAVTALRQQLQEGLERNQQLHRSLLGYAHRHGDHLFSGESSVHGDSQYLQNHNRGSSVYGLVAPCSNAATTPVCTKDSSDVGLVTCATGPLKAVHSSVQTSSHASAQTTPAAKQSVHDASTQAGENQKSKELSAELTKTAEAAGSQESLTSTGSYSPTQLAGMSAAVLCDLVSQLQEDLLTAVQHSAFLQRQLDTTSSGTGVVGQSVVPSGVTDIHAQVEAVQEKLKLKDEMILQQTLGPSAASDLTGSLATVANTSLRTVDLHAQIYNLQKQVKDMNRVNGTQWQKLQGQDEGGVWVEDQEVQKLRAENADLWARVRQFSAGVRRPADSVSSEEALDGNGNVRSEAAVGKKHRPAEGSLSEQLSSHWGQGTALVSPQLSDIAESFALDQSRNTNYCTDSSQSLLQDQSASRLPSSSQAPEGEWIPRLVGRTTHRQSEHSRLPRLAKVRLNSSDSAACGPPSSVASVGHKLQESQQQVRCLEERLVATEGTVRYMSQRLRYYRSLLQASKGGGEAYPGGRGLPRSQSETCLLDKPRLSLSFSCSDLREASQCPGHGGEMAFARSMRQRGSSLEEDGEPDTTRASSLICSKELMRHAPLTSQTDVIVTRQMGGGGTTGKGLPWSMSRMSSGSSDWPSSTQRPSPDPSPSPTSNRHANTTATTLLPSDTTFSLTLADDLPDGTVLDNLTYSSFSESILPLGRGHHDSAWSPPQAGQGQLSPKSQDSPDGHGGSARSVGMEESSHTEASRLKAHVEVLANMNRTLREELSVYDRLCCSMGVQVSLDGSSGSEESCDGETRLLQLHLAELRRLRTRMEQLDTEAHNAVHITSMLNEQQLKRIAELEALVGRLREELSYQRKVMEERQTTITERDRAVSEIRVIRQQQDEELQLLRDNLTALQDCQTQREEQVQELLQQVEALEVELEGARQQVKELEDELNHSLQRRQSYDVKYSKSQQTLHDLESQLTKVKRKLRSSEADLHSTQQSCQQMEAHLAEMRKDKEQAEFELAEAQSQFSVIDKEMTVKVEALEKELGVLKQDKEQMTSDLQCARERSTELEQRLHRECDEREQLMGEQGALQEECHKQQQRAQHYQERMLHYEECMRDYQHRVQDCETQVQQLQTSLQTSQSRELESDNKLRQAMGHIHHLQAQVKDAEDRAHTNESIAQRADTLAKTLEGRLRELEGKVKETEKQGKDSEYELRLTQSQNLELSTNLESVRRQLTERSAKLKKRDAQLKKLVEEYKKMLLSHKEMCQLNQTLKTEIRLYENMHCQTELSRDKKEELMRQLLSELSQTRRLAEDLITRLEHNKRNDSPASTAGPEAADGRPSPEPRESPSLLSLVSDTSHHHHHHHHPLRVQTENHNSSAQPRSSPASEHIGAKASNSSPSPQGSVTSNSRLPLCVMKPTTSHCGEAVRDQVCLSPSCNQWHPSDKDGGGSREEWGQGHTRSFSHPSSLKYWQDRPNASVNSLTGSPAVEVDSDVRRLFAISALEGYEKLKHENAELLATLSSMQARMADRLKTFAGVAISEVIKSVEYSTLRELHMSAQNLRICAEEENRLLSCFWLTQLPPLNARGEFYDPKLADENDSLKVELRKQRSRYDLLAHTVREQQERLHATNALRKKWETTLYKQLSQTNGILERSKENFDQAGLVPTNKQSSPRKASGQPIRDKN